MAVGTWLCSAATVVVLLQCLAVPVGGVRGHQRPPAVAGLHNWDAVRGRSVCRAQVDYSEQLRVLRAWCADGVEGQAFEARGRRYVCATLRLSVPYGDADVDVPGGCVARLSGVVANAATHSGDR